MAEQCEVLLFSLVHTEYQLSYHWLEPKLLWLQPMGTQLEFCVEQWEQHSLTIPCYSHWPTLSLFCEGVSDYTALYKGRSWHNGLGLLTNDNKQQFQSCGVLSIRTHWVLLSIFLLSQWVNWTMRLWRYFTLMMGSIVQWGLKRFLIIKPINLFPDPKGWLSGGFGSRSVSPFPPRACIGGSGHQPGSLI